MMVGRAVLTGFVAGVIAAVGFEFTGPAEPALLDAVTDDSSVWPRSLDVATYVDEVAPEICAHPFPFPSQRAHVYA
jgi:hypothetical protein